MLRKDAMVTCDVARKLVNDETKDVVLVMHSYGMSLSAQSPPTSKSC